jgi:hypothetical protein
MKVSDIIEIDTVASNSEAKAASLGARPGGPKRIRVANARPVEIDRPDMID